MEIKAGNCTEDQTRLVVRMTVLDMSNPLVHICYPLSTVNKGEGIAAIIASPGPKFEQYWCFVPTTLFTFKEQLGNYLDDGVEYAREVYNSKDFESMYSNSSISALHKYLPEDYVYNPEETAAEVFSRYFPSLTIASKEVIEAELAKIK